MTDPLLWLDGDPTDGRRARVHGAGPPSPAGAGPPARRRRLRPPRRAASAPRWPAGSCRRVLVGGGAFGLGLVDTGGVPTPPPRRRPRRRPPGARLASVGARRAGRRRRDLRRRAARPSCRSDGRGLRAPGFVVDPRRHARHQRPRRRQLEPRAGAVRRRRRPRRPRSRGVDRSSDLALLKVDTAQTARLHAALARRLEHRAHRPARGRDRLAVRARRRPPRRASCPAPGATSRRPTASRSTR